MNLEKFAEELNEEIRRQRECERRGHLGKGDEIFDYTLRVVRGYCSECDSRYVRDMTAEEAKNTGKTA